MAKGHSHVMSRYFLIWCVFFCKQNKHFNWVTNCFISLQLCFSVFLPQRDLWACVCHSWRSAVLSFHCVWYSHVNAQTFTRGIHFGVNQPLPGHDQSLHRDPENPKFYEEELINLKWPTPSLLKKGSLATVSWLILLLYFLLWNDSC